MTPKPLENKFFRSGRMKNRLEGAIRPLTPGGNLL